MEIPCYHNRPSAPTNLTRHQAIELNGPIACGDVAVFPGDVVIGDDEGVVIIPLHMVNDVSREAQEMTAFEDFVAERVAAGDAVIGLYPATSDAAKSAFAAWRKKTGR